MGRCEMCRGNGSIEFVMGAQTVYLCYLCWAAAPKQAWKKEGTDGQKIGEEPSD